jgi:hypothetical protein
VAIAASLAEKEINWSGGTITPDGIIGIIGT